MTRVTVQALPRPVTTLPLPAILLVGASALLTACEPAPVPMEKIPLTGEVKLEYSSTAGTAVFFNLDNGSRQELVFWGARGDQTVLPQRYMTDCTSLLGSGDSFGSTIIDGPDWELIRLPSGTRLRLSISESDFQGLENGRCSVKLELEGGAPIDSPQFELRGEANANDCIREKKDGNITGSCVIAIAKAEMTRRHDGRNRRRLSISLDATTGKWSVITNFEPQTPYDYTFLLISKDGQILEYNPGH